MEVPVPIIDGPAGPEHPTTAVLVTRLLNAQSLYADTCKLIADLEQQLAVLPPGRYPGKYSGQAVTVVGETTALKPNEGQIDAARKICGAHADLLFKRVESVAFKPVKGLREIAAVLLTPRRFKQLLALCEVPMKAHVRG